MCGGCIPSAPPPVAAGPVVQFLWVDFSYFMPALWQIWYFKNHHFRKVGGGCSPLSPLVSPGLLFNFSGSVLANLCLLYGNMVFLKITILGKSRGAVAPSASRSSRAGICVIGEYYVVKSVCASYLPSFRF